MRDGQGPAQGQRRAGHIVNISSVGGKVVSPHMVAYCASKFALTGLSAGLHIELARASIAVTARRNNELPVNEPKVVSEVKPVGTREAQPNEKAVQEM